MEQEAQEVSARIKFMTNVSSKMSWCACTSRCTVSSKFIYAFFNNCFCAAVASELGLWEAGSDCEVLNNWLPTEIEQLCEFGHQMVCNLGKWFAEKYQGQVDSRYMPLWRCSSSGRGKESGVDFIEGFRSEYLTKGEIPSVQRELSPDHYFRPWKIYCSEAKFIKSRINTEPRWVTKAEEHKEFLVKIFSLLKVLPAKIKSLPTLLWSTTYLVAIKDCELFATTADNNKVCLSRLIPDPGDWKLLNELACWVWAERFLFSGFEVHMGGHIAVDLLEVSLTPCLGCHMSIISPPFFLLCSTWFLFDYIMYVGSVKSPLGGIKPCPIYLFRS